MRSARPVVTKLLSSPMFGLLERRLGTVRLLCSDRKYARSIVSSAELSREAMAYRERSAMQVTLSKSGTLAR
jgi:hypothetical protein